MQHYQNEQVSAAEVEEIFSGLAFGIDANAWLSGRQTFFNNAEPLRARTKFSVAHYLFFGDPTRGLPALGYGSDCEREWTVKQIVYERNSLVCEPTAIYARKWRQNAGECIPMCLESTSTQQLKASIVACSAYLAMPPSTQDAHRLQRLIDQLKGELTRRITGPGKKKAAVVHHKATTSARILTPVD
ncbi:MAG TPA: hypothetical protein V6C81_24125 [Planktothrix sp.]|jgi:hypothetical protein